MKNYISIEEQLAGKDDSRIVIDKKKNGAEIFSYYLRAYKNRTDLATAVGSSSKENFLSGLEKAKNMIRKGDFSRAHDILTKLDPKCELEYFELILEMTRTLVYMGKYEEALAISSEKSGLADAPPVSRMSLLQARGHAMITLKNFVGAVDELEAAVALSELFPNANSGFMARTSLLKVYVEQEQKEKARRILEQLIFLLDGFKDDEIWLDRLLSVLRAEYTFFSKFDTPHDAMIRLKEAEGISNWFGEHDTAKRCDEDFKRLVEDYSLCEKQINKSQDSVLSFQNWQYFPRLDLILVLLPKSISRISKTPLTRKILLALSKGPVKKDVFFQLIWNLEYNGSRHDNHIRGTFSKIRNKLPKGGLSIGNDGFIYLK